MTAEPDAILLDVTLDKIPELIKRLSMYRLRAKIEIADESEKLGVIALFGGLAGEGARDSAIPTSGHG